LIGRNATLGSLEGLESLSFGRVVLEREIDIAARAGELPKDTDAELLSFELGGIALATNQAAQLHRDTDAAERGMRAVERLLDPR
jgi:hypothetical protein